MSSNTETVSTHPESSRRSRKLRLTGALMAGGVLLAGCADHNYAGTGNAFDVKAVVVDSGWQSVDARVLEVDQAHGLATDWFNDTDTHRFHDNCNCKGDFWNSRIKVGKLLDRSGVEVSPSSLLAGECVDIQGKIRDNHEGKTVQQRPVYDVAQEIACPQQ